MLVIIRIIKRLLGKVNVKLYRRYLGLTRDLKLSFSDASIFVWRQSPVRKIRSLFRGVNPFPAVTCAVKRVDRDRAVDPTRRANPDKGTYPPTRHD